MPHPRDPGVLEQRAPLSLLLGATSHLHKGVDSHDGHVRLTLGIVHQVQVHQLLQLQVVCLHTVHHVRKKGTGRFKWCQCGEGCRKEKEDFSGSYGDRRQWEEGRGRTGLPREGISGALAS